MPFPPEVFEGQLPEFRMCLDCKLKNLYENGLKRANTGTPFDVRLDRVARTVEDLEAKVEAFKKTHCKDEDSTKIDRLVGLLKKWKLIQMDLQTGTTNKMKK